MIGLTISDYKILEKLGETKEILHAEKNWLNVEKLLWGAGGVVVGVVLGAVLTK